LRQIAIVGVNALRCVAPLERIVIIARDSCPWPLLVEVDDRYNGVEGRRRSL